VAESRSSTCLRVHGCSDSSSLFRVGDKDYFSRTAPDAVDSVQPTRSKDPSESARQPPAPSLLKSTRPNDFANRIAGCRRHVSAGHDRSSGRPSSSRDLAIPCRANVGRRRLRCSEAAVVFRPNVRPSLPEVGRPPQHPKGARALRRLRPVRGSTRWISSAVSIPQRTRTVERVPCWLALASLLSTL